jgi:hypothetical protein
MVLTPGTLCSLTDKLSQAKPGRNECKGVNPGDEPQVHGRFPPPQVKTKEMSSRTQVNWISFVLTWGELEGTSLRICRRHYWVPAWDHKGPRVTRSPLQWSQGSVSDTSAVAKRLEAVRVPDPWNELRES